MRAQIQLSWFSLCLSVMFEGCSAQHSTQSYILSDLTSSDQKAFNASQIQERMENNTDIGSDPPVPSLTSTLSYISKHLRENSSDVLTSQPDSLPGSTVVPTVHFLPTTTNTEQKLTEEKNWDQPFHYNYRSLRQAGLAVAFVLFVIGIVVLACNRACQKPSCRVGKSYEVNQA